MLLYMFNIILHKHNEPPRIHLHNVKLKILGKVINIQLVT